jgi:tetratricopeptide (TPR) repeat protein
MARPGRNDPCPCGSGKKYKKCCLPKDEAADQAQFMRATAEAAEAANARNLEEQAQEAAWESMQQEHDEALELTEKSNAVIALVKAGKLDEAESAARDLLVRFPYVHDGYDRLGMVYEARGQNKQAADCYRQVIEFVGAHPDQYEPEFADTFHRLVAKLDPETGART